MSHGSFSSARETAIAIIRDEHSKIKSVAGQLRRTVHDIERLGTQPDFWLLSAILYYLEEFPEQLHHPKEDEYIFDVLNRRSGEFRELLSELQSEHLWMSETIMLLQRSVIRYQGGAPRAYENLRTLVDGYVDLLLEHMRKEETLLAGAGDCLAPEDWADMAAAFESNDHPQFGLARRRELGWLRTHISNILPRRLKAGAEIHDP